MIGKKSPITHLKERIAEIKQERDALAAHINQIHACFSFEATTRPQDVCKGVLSVLKQAPATSLARRDLIKQAEMLYQVQQKATEQELSAGLVINAMLEELRQQAAQLETDQ